MARKMKVVPESWYKKILALNSQQDVDLDLEEKLKAEKTNIFGNSTIPDEVKILLLQNLNRQLIDNKSQDDKWRRGESEVCSLRNSSFDSLFLIQKATTCEECRERNCY